MRSRPLGSTSTEISPIGLGCMQFAGPGMSTGFYQPLAQETVTSIVRTSLEGGVTWFDTAEMYGRGHSERALSTALHSLDVAPGDVVVASKWTPIGRPASSIVRTIGARRASLAPYPLDLHQIHMAHGSLSTQRRQVEAMAALQTAGRIGAVGVSGFSAAQMERADAVLRGHGLRLASNQVEISLLRRSIETNGVLAAARRLGVTLIAFSPLKSGFLTGKFHDDPARAASLPWPRRTLGRFTRANLDRTRPLIDEQRAIGRAHGVGAAQVALSWLIRFYGDTVVAIPGASRPRHAAESVEAMHVQLTDRELERLDAVSRPFARGARSPDATAALR
ncbi:aldo/keto reductase [Beutenbergia cavernae DSM 12333]|uniref:Aldo/keto reductase n=1 Tax=Beutenbergia cavernae (strain ATCC BAA-8 / DSM 12333 / CCUG 43141 / JCM 11478 / NBRC 16432 / NCIMB 13614 / HKI 0122) TaxID=471853 RepID=C5BZL8_BEUC1|nr:aldo/keto reductase [Beutenbergia cavernae]ACQ79190.1 aldo/keto reductase [Beutenbergia cavernae DSM 12333]